MDQPTVDICAAEGCDNATKAANRVNGMPARFCSRRCQDGTWKRLNRDRTRKYGRDHYARNIEAGRERSRKARAADPLAHRERVRSWIERNADRVAAYNRAYDAANRDRRIARQANRRALIRNSCAKKLDPDLVRDRMAYYGYRCWMCRAPYEHIDHVKPLSKGGPHMLSNLRPACGPCNQFKYAKWFGPHLLGELQRHPELTSPTDLQRAGH